MSYSTNTLKDNLFVTLFKDHKTDFISEPTTWSFVLRAEIKLNSKCNKKKWEFIAEKQGGDQWMENH